MCVGVIFLATPMYNINTEICHSCVLIATYKQVLLAGEEQVTIIKRGTIHPIFNARFEFLVPSSKVEDQMIIVEVISRITERTELPGRA